VNGDREQRRRPLALGGTVELPFWFGTIVYLCVRTERVRGIVTGYNVRKDELYVQVTWGNDGRETPHSPYELTTEFQPDFEGSD
jgi:hypothetical protein